MKTPLRVLLVGAKGRMGHAVAAAAARETDLRISAGVDRDDPLAPVIDGCDLVIDFSAADATAEVCRLCVEHGKPLVLGTTGQSETQRKSVIEAARMLPLVFAANFSVGVNVLFALTRQAAESLGRDFDVNVVEMHHRTKKDAPSGTAKRLLEILRQVRGGENEIAAHSIRASDIVGEHTVIFSGRGERLELTHRAASRENFAAGALRAARWVAGRSPGLYSMEDVLGISLRR